MYTRSNPSKPTEITRNEFLYSVFDIGEYLELPIETSMNAFYAGEAFMKLPFVKNKLFINELANKKIRAYSKPIEKIYSIHLAYVCNILSAKFYGECYMLDIDQAEDYSSELGNDYLYKMELDIFFSLETASFLNKEQSLLLEILDNLNLPETDKKIICLHMIDYL
jgi:hypothetical protein